MIKKTDQDLGMSRSITRRDFIHDAARAALAATFAPAGIAAGAAAAASPLSTPSATDYPPVRTGLRGSHPGAFETAHALARDGKKFPKYHDTGEAYDLVIVGAGISGLATAHYYQRRFGQSARILLLENHDDFGGHAKRNEFHQGGRMVLSMGGAHNLEWWEFGDTVNTFLAAHDVDVKAMAQRMDFEYGHSAANSPAMWFDDDSYSDARLLTNCDLGSKLSHELIDLMPVSAEARESLKQFYREPEDVFRDKNEVEREAYLRSISYTVFLRRHGGLSDEAIQLFAKLQHGGWGLEMRALSAMEGMESGAPGRHLLGENWNTGDRSYPVAMWPDGNASLARLQVARLIPAVAPGATADNIALAKFDYDALDRTDSPVRLRLNATVVNVSNTDSGAEITYLAHGKTLKLRSRHCVLACYHSIIPHLCPELPDAQHRALKHQVKHPLLLTNVLIRNTNALDKLGIDAVSCPGRLHASLFTFRGINNGGFEHAIDDSGPVSLIFWGSISPPAEAVDVKSQLRASRTAMLELSFEDYEREVRTVLDGLLGPAGFDVQKDILAITVNRWPHGYAYEYLDLWDGDYGEGEAPHEIARQRFGNITIANADAGASAYAHVAIDQAYRAVQELDSKR